MSKSAVKRGAKKTARRSAAGVKALAAHIAEVAPDLSVTRVAPVSEETRLIQLLRAINTLRHRKAPGERSRVWRLNTAVLHDAAKRCIIGSETVTGVYADLRAAMRRAGVNEKRFGEWIARVRDLAGEKEEQRLLSVNGQAEIQHLGNDLDAIMAHIACPLAARLLERLRKDDYNETEASFQHLTMRMYEAFTSAAEVQRKNNQRDAQVAKMRQAIEAYRKGQESGEISVAPEDQGYALELLTRGIVPTRELIAQAKVERAAERGVKGVAA